MNAISKLIDTTESAPGYIAQAKIKLPRGAGNAEIIQSAKRALGLRADARCRAIYRGREIELRFPRNAQMIAYIHLIA